MSKIGKINRSDHIYALKIKTESNNLGLLKTMLVLFLIFSQAAFLILGYVYFMGVFQWYTIVSIIISLICCVHVLSSDFHGQAKATWVLFLLFCFGFGYVFYLMSEKHILFARSRKKYNKIFKQRENLQEKRQIKDKNAKNYCDFLYEMGNFVSFEDSKTKYFPSGTRLYDELLEDLKKAKEFIFIEYYIIANGILLDKILQILKQKVKDGVDVRIIYDDMGCHKTLKRKSKKQIRKMGIKLVDFNRMVPIFNIALNLRDHRKIVVIDGKISYTGGANIADEYVNEKRVHGYWKDAGIKIEGPAVNNFTIAFLIQWQFVTNVNEDFSIYLNKAEKFESDGVVIPFVSGPNYNISIAQNMFTSVISNAKEKIYIMTPYFVPDETLTNLIINRAKSGVDVRIILPEIADKNFVYIVSRNNAEKLLEHGVKIYTMSCSFVHSKVVFTENSAIVGSINMDLRSFYQQFESAVLTTEKSTLLQIKTDFDKTIMQSKQITDANKKRNSLSYRIVAGIFKIVSPFM